MIHNNSSDDDLATSFVDCQDQDDHFHLNTFTLSMFRKEVIISALDNFKRQYIGKIFALACALTGVSVHIIGWQ